LGNVTAARVGVVGRGDFVGMVHIFYDTDLCENQLPGSLIRAGIPATGNGNLEGSARAGLPFCRPGWDTTGHNLDRGDSIETELSPVLNRLAGD